MRITNNMANQLAVLQLDVARTKLEEAQRKVSTGKKFTSASEDPTSALTVMANSGAMRALDQYKRNIGVASRRLTFEETALNSVTDVVTRAKELAVSQGSDTATLETRRGTLAEVNQLIQQVVTLANTKDGNDFLFGGTTTDVAPFTADTSGPVTTFTASGSSGTRDVEIASGQLAKTAHNATQVFGTETQGILKSLQDLATALNTGTAAAVAATIPGLDTSLNQSQAVLAEVGARQNQMQIAETNISAFSQSLLTLNSNLQDVDLETAMVDLVNRQTSYQAAMSATSRVLNLNLTDYLR